MRTIICEEPGRLVFQQTERLAPGEGYKREATLMSSRNATREDFDHVIAAIKRGWVQPANYISHRITLEKVTQEFESLLDPANGVIKAIIEVE